MKKMLFISALSLVLFACKKENDKTPTELFTAGTWSQIDTARETSGTPSTTVLTYSVTLSETKDSIILSGFLGALNRLAFAKFSGTTKSIGDAQIKSGSFGFISDLVITRISATQLKYTFSESFAALNPKQHTGSCTKN